MGPFSTHFEMKTFQDSGMERESLFQLYKKTLKTHVEGAFEWQEAEQRSRFDRSYPSGEISILLQKSAFVGYLAVRSKPYSKHIALLLIEPTFQRIGIGREVMGALHSEAVQSSQVVTLSCFKSNLAALAFYESLGYKVLSEDSFFVDLQWTK